MSRIQLRSGAGGAEDADAGPWHRAAKYLANIRRHILLLSGWRRAAVAMAAGAVSVLAMAPFFLWPVLFVTLPVLVWLIDASRDPSAPQNDSGLLTATRREARRAAVAGWWFGFGYFLAGLYWIGAAFLVEAEKFAWLMPFAVTLLPAGLALFYAAAAGAARLLWKPGPARLLVLALALAGAEWLRGHVLTGFPWNVLGYALTSPLSLMQAAAVLGIYGLTLWTIVVCAAPLVLAADAADESGNPIRRILAGLGVALVPLAILYAYGLIELAKPPAPMADGVHLRIVQPSVPQRDKWRQDKQRDIFLQHLELSRRDASGKRDDLAGITHLIWPEAAMPFLPLETPEALSAIGELLPAGTYLLTGALRVEAQPSDAAQPAGGRRRIYNSLIVLAHGGGLAALYDKIHLVPFGEYLPLQGTLEAIGLEQLTRIRGGFAVGGNPRPLLDVMGLPRLAGLICYEAIFPAAIVQGAERPGVLVNVTNDGWFGPTIGPHQHFHQARVRAVEEGLPLIRAANNGISAVIDAEGRILHKLGLDESGSFDSALPSARGVTLYGRFGDLIFAFNVVLFAALWGVMSRPQ